MLDIIKTIIELFSNNKKPLLFGVLLTPIFFYTLSGLFGVTPKMHLKFLSGDNPYIERYKLVSEHLNSINSEVSNYENLSHKRQLDLLSIVDVNIKNQEDLAKTYKMINRNQDIIRTLMEFGKFHSVLVDSEEYTKDSQKSLKNMYKAYLNILKGDNVDQFIDKAYSLFKTEYNNLENFPEPLRSDVKIEILNFLTYCSFRKGYPDEANRYSANAVERELDILWFNIHLI